MGSYLAWIAPTETTFGPEHIRKDEQVFAFRLTCEEGRAPALTVDIRNPRIGLLNAARQVWVWFSVDEGTGVTPLFRGRLIGVPQDMQDEVVRLEFIAKPTDLATQKAALADEMKVAPYWDPALVTAAERENPDAVLVARTEVWHIDPVTHVLTSSNVLFGEDGTVDLMGRTFPDSTSITYGNIPARRCIVSATFQWQQVASGVVEIGPRISAAFGGVMATYSRGMEDAFPTGGEDFGGGWTVAYGRPNVFAGRDLWTTTAWSTLPALRDVYQYPLIKFYPQLAVAYAANRSFEEVLTFELEMDVQPLATEPGEDDALTLTLSTSDVDQPVDPPTSDYPLGELPIRDVRRRAYLPTDRGLQSVEYVVTVARAMLLRHARCIELRGECSFADGLAFSLRKNVALADDRIPGGSAVGKLISYTLSSENGVLLTEFTLGCTIGKGTTVTAASGTPEYVDADALEPGIQLFVGQTTALAGSTVTYALPTVTPNDDGIDFFNVSAANTVLNVEVFNPPAVQMLVIQNSGQPFSDPAFVPNALRELFTEVQITMKPVTGGPYQTAYALEVSELTAPNTIDLEAGSA